jgi:DNA gyrase subunit A
VDVSNEDRAAYLKVASTKRRTNGDEEPETPAEPEEVVEDVTLSDDRIAALELAEEFLLTVTAGGFGKRRSA